MIALIDSLNAKDITKNDFLFALLKNKRYANTEHIHQKYWDKIAEDLNMKCVYETQELETNSTIPTLCHWYYVLQNGKTNNYRCQRLETLLRELALIDIKYGVSSWKPQRLSKLAMFLIGFANNSSSDYVTLPDDLIKKVEEMAPQFSIKEIIDISKGVEMLRRNGLPNRWVCYNHVELYRF